MVVCVIFGLIMAVSQDPSYDVDVIVHAGAPLGVELKRENA